MTMHDRLSLNQATIKRADLSQALTATAAAGIPSIGLWREPVHDVGLSTACAMVADSGLRVSSLCRGGFFTSDDREEQQRARDDNLRAIDEIAQLAAAGAAGSAPVLVLVAGGLPEASTDLQGARERATTAIADLVDAAAAAQVTLAVEPMHPMYAADRGVISSLRSALDIAEHFDPTTVGVVVDAFHIWWDPDVYTQIARAGAQQRISSYQINDWITPLPADALLSRGLPGQGHIDLRALTRAVVDAGYGGDIEVEIFNADIWARPFDDVLRDILEATSPMTV
ncbi:sugar phosphate isomerase/epimerase family protein [Gordonia aquimaris]|jgi:sugar phosphate isomerase/epimerase|uniref:Sugar phosphate isomerase/epimerase n=1 Tax=Gordonia aquimaris TaxID=2984863 RepID=A0A9X3D923_9ACTN|nr:sugar phosphate isomerase/epimerase family protein [Gordonia aquimaris]MCX2965941.1 sugar phosphate isomerase/epimerase [Gordonia aquimaris]